MWQRYSATPVLMRPFSISLQNAPLSSLGGGGVKSWLNMSWGDSLFDWRFFLFKVPPPWGGAREVQGWIVCGHRPHRELGRDYLNHACIQPPWLSALIVSFTHCKLTMPLFKAWIAVLESEKSFIYYLSCIVRLSAISSIAFLIANNSAWRTVDSFDNRSEPSSVASFHDSRVFWLVLPNAHVQILLPGDLCKPEALYTFMVIYLL